MTYSGASWTAMTERRRLPPRGRFRYPTQGREPHGLLGVGQSWYRMELGIELGKGFVGLDRR